MITHRPIKVNRYIAPGNMISLKVKQLRSKSEKPFY